MAGHYSRQKYDSCATAQDDRQRTAQLGLIMDINKYVNANNICQPDRLPPMNAVDLVDVESSLWGIDKRASRCDHLKHPGCHPYGCLETRDPRVPSHITPYACERGTNNSVVRTNMRPPTDNGIVLPNRHDADSARNGYYHQNSNKQNVKPKRKELGVEEMKQLRRN